MLQLRGPALTVELLDPVADASRLGPRFCSGGFIWQVRDASGQPLLTGPEWPEPSPHPFNGQGLPESFRHRTLAGQPLTWRGPRGVAIGAGELATDAAGAVALVDPCRWQVNHRNHQADFTTRHEAAGFSYRLRRTVVLDGSVLHSMTELTNAAAGHLAAEWFAHPFFALPDDGLARVDLPPGSTLAPNPGFELFGAALRQKRRFQNRDDGHFDHLRLPEGAPLRARIAHPTVGTLAFTTSFVPASCVVWGNDRTFSLEPYLAFDLAPGATLSWSLEYKFG